MKTTYLLMLPLSVFALSACTPSDSPTSLPPGHYEKTTSNTDANGTDVKQKTSTDVTVDQYGNKRAVVNNKTTTDPKGLFNKSTNSSTQVIEQK